MTGVAPSLLLGRAQAYFQGQVAPLAPRLDRSSQALAAALAEMGDRGFLALKVPPDWGGAGLDGPSYWRFQQGLARASGALAFLQAQHQSAAAAIAQGSNDALKAQWLPEIAQGKAKLGISFSHLRRPGEPWLQAMPEGRGYRLQGSLPWATGWGLFDELVAAATLPDGDSLWMLLPFGSCRDSRGQGSLSCSDPMALAAFGAANTVSLSLNDFWLRPDQVIDQHPPGWLAARDRRNLLQGTALPLGCAEAALDWVARAVQQRGRGQASLDRLYLALADCQGQILQSLESSNAEQSDPEHLNTERLALRARAIALMGRCAQAAVVATAGAANLQGNPAQRLYREALVFSVGGQTEALWETSLAQLSQDLPSG